MFFFFQAEDGIRDLVRSRGLGDVYKRQSQGKGYRRPVAQIDLVQTHRVSPCHHGNVEAQHGGRHAMPGTGFTPHGPQAEQCQLSKKPVSYTHLTLPTSDLV